MSCNGYNHHPACNCGFRGSYRDVMMPRQQLFDYPNVHPNWSRPDSYTVPNVVCRDCGEHVFFYRSPDGGCVLFDSLGPPWPIHPCFLARQTPPYPSGEKSQQKVIGTPLLTETSYRDVSDTTWTVLRWTEVYIGALERGLTVIKAYTTEGHLMLYCSDVAGQLRAKGPMYYRLDKKSRLYNLSALVSDHRGSVVSKNFTAFDSREEWRQYRDSLLALAAQATVAGQLLKQSQSPLTETCDFGGVDANNPVVEVCDVKIEPGNITKIVILSGGEKRSFYAPGRAPGLWPGRLAVITKLLPEAVGVTYYQIRVLEDYGKWKQFTNKSTICFDKLSDIEAVRDGAKGTAAKLLPQDEVRGKYRRRSNASIEPKPRVHRAAPGTVIGKSRGRS